MNREAFERRIEKVEAAIGGKGRRIVVWADWTGEPVEPLPADLGPDDEVIHVSWGKPVYEINDQ